MFGAMYYGQALFGWVPLFMSGGSTTPSATFVSYNAEVTTFVSWQDTP